MSKTVRIAIPVLVVAVVVVALILRSHRSRNIAALAAYQAELRAKGEKLTAEDLGYPKPPESPASLSLLRAGVNAFPGRIFFREFMPYVGPGRVEVVWATPSLAASAGSYSGTNAGSWEAISARFEAAAAALRDLRDAAQLPPRYFFNDPTNFSIMAKGPFVELRSAAQCLAGDALVALHAGQLDRAQADLRALTGLAQFHQEDLTLVSQMIRAAIAGLGLEVTWEALQAPGWNGEQLAAMQKDWEAVDLADTLEKGIVGERAFGAAAMAHMRSLSPRARTAFWRSGSQPTSLTVGEYLEEFALAALWTPNSEADELLALQFFQKSLDSIRSLRAGTPMIKVNRQLQSHAAELGAITATPLGRYRYFHCSVAIPNFARAGSTCIRCETQRRLTLTAITLERYRLRNGKLPTELKALAPQFFPTAPIDPMSGEPLRYRLNADGSFTLYSVGEDGRDDGGDPNPPVVTNKFGLWEGKDAVWPVAVKQ